MEEAERLCDRVGIIDEGRLVAEGTRDELIALVGADTRVALTATTHADHDPAGVLGQWAQRCRDLPGVLQARPADGSLELITHDGSRLVAAAVTAAGDLPLSVTSVEVTEPDLEAVFLHLTGKALRD
jgi:ABC-2 type transport system ATP-binding protein